jgi:hypothetical protein
MFASGFQELFVALINKRGKELRAGIAQLLAGIDATGRTNTRLADTVLGHSLIDSLSPKKRLAKMSAAERSAWAAEVAAQARALLEAPTIDHEDR